MFHIYIDYENNIEGMLRDIRDSDQYAEVYIATRTGPDPKGNDGIFTIVTWMGEGNIWVAYQEVSSNEIDQRGKAVMWDLKANLLGLLTKGGFPFHQCWPVVNQEA